MLKSMFTISRAADFIGVSVSTLRRWEKSGDLIPDARDLKTGYRYYSKRNINEFKKKKYCLSSKLKVELNNKKYKFNFIDLFAGIGGIRLGFERYGGTCVFSSEIDKYAQLTYEYIFGDKPHGDIYETPLSKIPSHEILLGGFPCQPFSIAGVSKYGSLGWDHGFKHKTKGNLFFKIAEILDSKRPEAFLLENVKNLRSHDSGKTWKVIYETLTKELGYNVEAKIIDARGLVPQHRERIFIAGFRESVSFSWPEIPDLEPSIGDILDDDVDDKYVLSDHMWDYLQRYAEKHRMKGNGFGFGLVNHDGVARTLSARYHKDGSEILIPLLGKNPRRLTPAECSRLMGFSQFNEKYEKPVVSDTQAYRQFGNAVVPPIIAYIARQMLSALYDK
nr:DNA (cytosine-5-)-methyltransferase [uncultured Dethiosulfovibrio sp.]